MDAESFDWERRPFDACSWSALRPGRRVNHRNVKPGRCYGRAGLTGAFSLAVGNEAGIAVLLSMLTLAPYLGQLELGDFVIVAAFARAILTGALAFHALVANRVRGRLVATPAAIWLPRATSGARAGVAVAIVAR